MILLLDVGNTRVKWAWLEFLDLAPAGAVAHNASRRSWQREIEADGHRPQRIVVASVAGPAFAAALTLWARDHYRVEPEFITASRELCGVRNGYRRAAALGIDRWLAMVAAWQQAPGATLVISSGTALTVDVVGADGRHRGGLILPGVGMMRDARARIETDPVPMAENLLTVASGGVPAPDCAVRTLAALADRACEEGERTLGERPRALLTGGGAPVLAPHLRHPVELVPDLVLSGLAIVATRDTGAG